MTDRVRDGLGHEYAAAFLEHAVLEHCIASNTFCVAFRMRDGVHTGIPSRTGWQLLTSLPLTAISPREPTSMLSGLFLPRLFLSGGSDARFESWKTLNVLAVAFLASCMWLVATTPVLAADEEHPEATEASAAADAHGDSDHGDAHHMATIWKSVTVHSMAMSFAHLKARPTSRAISRSGLLLSSCCC